MTQDRCPAGRWVARHRWGLHLGVSLVALAAGSGPVLARQINFAPASDPSREATQAITEASAQAAKAAVMAQRSIAAFQRAAQATQNMAALQAAARAAAQAAASAVPDGIGPGGLNVSPLVDDPSAQVQGIVWQNAARPVQTTTKAGDGKPVVAPDGTQELTVTVKQTAPKAILSWDSFNVGKHTNLEFVQRDSAGKAQHDWVALNRIVAGRPDPVTGARATGGSPSKILGSLKADGEVYIINPNGMIFGGSSQVNVHALVASAVDVGLPTSFLNERNSYFLNANDSKLTFSFQYLIDRSGAGRNGVAQKPIFGLQSGTLRITQLLSDAPEGNITVEAGALIQTPGLGKTQGSTEPSNDTLGRVVLAGPNVGNAGTISTPDGQAMLVSARHFTLYSNNAQLLQQAGAPASLLDPNLRGSLVVTGLQDGLAINPVYANDLRLIGSRPTSGTYIHTPLGDPATFLGSTRNDGMIAADRGNVTLTGNEIVANGIVSTTTSVNQNGSVSLQARAITYTQQYGTDDDLRSSPNNPSKLFQSLRAPGEVDIGPEAAILLLPDADPATLPSDAQSSAQFGKPVLNVAAEGGLRITATTDELLDPATGLDVPRFLDQSRISVENGALIKAPSASVSLTASDPTLDPITNLPPETVPDQLAPSIVIGKDAVVDVSGVADVELPISSVVIRIPRVGLNELADVPILRGGILYRQEVFVDRRRSGKRADGSIWEGTPLLNANGYVDAYGRGIGELLQDGGSINLNGASAIKSGALLDVSGGYIQYLGGRVDTTRLIGADGKIYGIGSAKPNQAYAGIADHFTVHSAKWGVTLSYRNGFSAGQYEEGYVQGADAGTLTIAGPAVLDGTVKAGVVTGPNQNTGLGALSGPPPKGGTLDLSGQVVNTRAIVSHGMAGLPDDLQAAQAIDSAIFLDRTLGTDTIAESGVGALKLAARQSIGVDANATLTLPNGGSLAITAPNIDIEGGLVVHSGQITLTAAPFVANPSAPPPYGQVRSPTDTQPPRVSLTVGGDAKLDVSGLWVNDSGLPSGLAQGSTFVNGGSVTLRDAPLFVESSGNRDLQDVADITVAEGGVIDLTSGGYVGSNGKLATDSSGVALGRGGNFSLILHGGSALAPRTIPLDPASVGLPLGQATQMLDDNVVLAGSLRAYGFQGGGAFVLAAPELRIGEGTLGGSQGVVTVPVAFIENAGFGSYDLTGLMRATIDPGTVLHLSQKQLFPVAGAPFATDLASAAILARTEGLQHTPVNFSVSGYGWTDFLSPIRSGKAYDGSPYLNAALVADGVQIVADPKASLSFRAIGQLTFGGSIQAPGGSVSFTENHLRVQPDIGTAIDLTPNASLLLRPGTKIDVSGRFLRDPTQVLYRSGQVIAGGSVSLLANRLLVPQGVAIDVSGARGTVDLPSAGQAHYTIGDRVPTEVSSDAGVVTFGGNLAPTQGGVTIPVLGTGAFDGTINAQPGAPGGIGGTVNVLDQALTVADADALLPDDLEPGAPLPVNLPSNALVVAADKITGNGIDRLSLLATGTAAPGGTPLIAFSGSPTLAVRRELDISASELSWLPTGVLDPAVRRNTFPPNVQGTVTLDSAYVGLSQHGPDQTNVAFGSFAVSLAPFVDPANVALTIKAGTLDVAGGIAVDRYTTTNIATMGDMRLVPSVAPDGTISTLSGLVVAGDLNISAAQIYPATGTTGLLRSARRNTGTITIASNGQPAPVPLSAGGVLAISAAFINQGGILRAPLGHIVLGNAVRTIAGTGSAPASLEIDLLPGSLTSVSAEGRAIPYGQTVAQTDWFYYGTDPSKVRAGDAASNPLSALPDKQIVIDADSVNEQKNEDTGQKAVLDLSGGGDLFAVEFIAGNGGTRNVLRASLTGDPSAPVYTIVPGAQPAVAPIDYDLTGGVAESLHGLTVTTLADVPGLPAGTYTLLPGDYGNLPGAIRVQPLPGTTQDLPAGSTFLGTDGSYVVAGRTGFNGTDIRSSRTLGFSIMPEALWRQYSQIERTSGNAFFAAKAADQGLQPSRLPIDAGQLTLSATTGLAIDGLNRFAPAEGGRGGQANISASNLEVASADVAAEPDFLLLTPKALHNLAAESILLGGTRLPEMQNGQATGRDQLTVTANNLLIATSDADPLSNPDLLLAATGTVEIRDGSVVEAKGASSGAPSGILVAGKGTLLRLSTAGMTSITRNGAIGNGGIMVGTGGKLLGNGALQLSIPGAATVATDATLAGKAIELAGSDVHVLGAAGTPGLNLGQATLGQLARASAVTLRGFHSLSFDAPVTLALAKMPKDAPPSSLTLDAPILRAQGFDAGTVFLQADSVTITNTSAGAVQATGGTDTLEVAADRISLTGTDKSLQGFGVVSLAATEEILSGQGIRQNGLGTVPSGSLNAVADLAFAAPQLTLADASSQRIVTSGAFRFGGDDGTFSDSDQIGGRLDVDAGSIAIDGTIVARGGAIDLRARDQDVELGANARLLAGGFSQPFADKTLVVPGGRVSLATDRGNVTARAGSEVDLAASAGGDAGSLSVALGAESGQLALGGTVKATGGAVGGASSSFLVDSVGALDLDSLAGIVGRAGFGNRFVARSGAGDLVLSTTLPTLREAGFYADAGAVEVKTTIDISGKSGGRIDLFGSRGVVLDKTAQLSARASDPAQRGGQVNIGTSGTGILTLTDGSVIDVSGGSPYGSGGGTVHFRIPFLDSAPGTIAGHQFGATLVGVNNAILEPYQVIDLDSDRYAHGAITQSVWSDKILQDFAPNVAPLAQLYAQFSVQPGLELVQPNGSIVFREPGPAGKLQIDLSGRRYGPDQAPGWLTVRAAGDLVVDGSISDGFISNTTPIAGWLLASSGNSWSYRLVGGADLASANPLAVRDAADLTGCAPAGCGNVVLGNLGGPELIRTGTGSISLAAGRSVSLIGPNAAIYTAGVQTASPDDFTPGPLFQNGGYTKRSDPTGAFPTHGGDISIFAQADFNDPAANYGSRYYSLANGGVTSVVPWAPVDGIASIDPTIYGVFGNDGPIVPGRTTAQSAEAIFTGQIVNAIAALGGGDLTLRTGGDVNDALLYVMSPFRVTGGTSPGSRPQLHRYGGGKLTVVAGDAINGGVFYVDQGGLDVSAGDAIARSALRTGPNGIVLGFGDASATIAARSGLAIQNVFGQGSGQGASLYNTQAIFMSMYGLDDRFRAITTAGDVTMGIPANIDFRAAIPEFYMAPTTTIAATAGSIQLIGRLITAPGPAGTLDLLAGDSVQLGGAIQMLDIDPAVLATPLHPEARTKPQPFHFSTIFEAGLGFFPSVAQDGANNYTLHAGPIPLHSGDTEPSHIVAVSGDIGAAPGGFGASVAAARVSLAEAGTLSAGRDIYGLTFKGQNNAASDTTIVQAGRDIGYGDATVPLYGSLFNNAPSDYIIGGPGQFQILAGRNLRIQPSDPTKVGTAAVAHGVQSVANLVNPWLGRSSADVSLFYGLQYSMDVAGFVTHYIAPDNGDGSYRTQLIDYLVGIGRLQFDPDRPPSADTLRTIFLALSRGEQMRFVERVFFDELRSVAPDANSAALNDPQRALTAIATLFPPKKLDGEGNFTPGYTDNSENPVDRTRTGDFRMLDAVVRTEFGSSINIFGPGGDALLGTLALNPNLPPNVQGIFTSRGGSIDVFLDGDFLVNNSRVFTEQGGDETIFSANGSIDAGRGKKTAVFNPPLTVRYGAWLSAQVDPSGAATGSGIGTLATLPDSPPGNIFLLAPHGDIDAGEAGIRSSGNLSLVAARVVNGENINVSGNANGTGVGGPNVGALNAASAVTAQSTKMADQVANRALPQNTVADIPSVITVEVIGFGG